MKTAFVTGGTGFVGVILVSGLIEQGWTVTCLHRPQSELKYLRRFPVQLEVGELADEASLVRSLPGGVDAVFHVAADTSSWRPLDAAQTATNVAGTRHLVSAARKREARRFVLTSTASAYGRQRGPISEATHSNAATSWINYERSKWLAEEEVRRGVLDGLPAVIVNPCAVFGPFDTSVWGNVFRAIRDDRMKVLPPGAVPVNHANEVARAHIAAAERGRTGENYLLGGDAVPLAYIFREIARLMGLELRAPVVPRFVFKGTARVIASIAKWTGRLPEMTPEMAEILCGTNSAASDKAQRDLGYRPRPLAECLKDSFQWLQKEGLL